jgi:mannose-6-phosphate isomerase-like protein (cupin superfamily)
LFIVPSACNTRLMTSSTEPLRSIPYASDVLNVLGECAGMAVCEMSVPPGFPGPPAHVHHGFDEAIYVLDGELLVVSGRSDARPVPAGSLVLAARGTRHTFRNPSDRPVRVLGIWSPGSALEFMAEIGAALPASGPPDPARIAEAYRRHNSEVLP